MPENLADPWYEWFVGEVVPIWCTSFESSAADWSLFGQFRAGPLSGGSSVDPGAPWGADPIVLGTALDGVGEYEPWTGSSAVTPTIAIPPGFASVRLQYRRWLTVEDGFFDRAWILADGDEVWANYASEDEEIASVHHRDREWRFHDVDVTSAAADGTLELELGLESDGGLQLGGWTIDDVCVVGFSATAATCGNGILEAGESCDDGNDEPGDGCDACVPTGGGSGGGDGGGPGGDDEGDDDPGDPGGPGDPDGGGEPGLDDDGFVDRGCVCTSSPQREPISAAWWLLALLVRPRRIVSRIRAAPARRAQRRRSPCESPPPRRAAPRSP
jgi:cysteine-rich repeat protein